MKVELDKEIGSDMVVDMTFCKLWVRVAKHMDFVRLGLRLAVRMMSELEAAPQDLSAPQAESSMTVQKTHRSFLYNIVSESRN